MGAYDNPVINVDPAEATAAPKGSAYANPLLPPQLTEDELFNQENRNTPDWMLKGQRPSEKSEWNKVGQATVHQFANAMPITGAAMPMNEFDAERMQKHPELRVPAEIGGAVAGSAPAFMGGEALAGPGLLARSVASGGVGANLNVGDTYARLGNKGTSGDYIKAALLGLPAAVAPWLSKEITPLSKVATPEVPKTAPWSPPVAESTRKAIEGLAGTGRMSEDEIMKILAGPKQSADMLQEQIIKPHYEAQRAATQAAHQAELDSVAKQSGFKNSDLLWKLGSTGAGYMMDGGLGALIGLSGSGAIKEALKPIFDKYAAPAFTKIARNKLFTNTSNRSILDALANQPGEQMNSAIDANTSSKY